MGTEEKDRVRFLKKRLAHLLQTRFIAGGDNSELREKIDSLREDINEIERKHRVAAKNGKRTS